MPGAYGCRPMPRPWRISAKPHRTSARAIAAGLTSILLILRLRDPRIRCAVSAVTPATPFREPASQRVPTFHHGLACVVVPLRARVRYESERWHGSPLSVSPGASAASERASDVRPHVPHTMTRTGARSGPTVVRPTGQASPWHCHHARQRKSVPRRENAPTGSVVIQAPQSPSHPCVRAPLRGVRPHARARPGTEGRTRRRLGPGSRATTPEALALSWWKRRRRR